MKMARPSILQSLPNNKLHPHMAIGQNQTGATSMGGVLSPLRHPFSAVQNSPVCKDNPGGK